MHAHPDAPIGRVMPNNRLKILGGIDLATAEGLEIGPLASPILRRPEARVHYVDHVDTETLRRKYANDPKLDTAAFVPVDIAWSDGTLREAVARALPGPEKWFSYVIASHVIEHVPDIIWWLAEIRTVLSSGGALRLVIPDRRFTMDFGRRETILADALSAYLQSIRHPRPREILDFYIRYQNADVTKSWNGTEATRQMFPLSQATLAIRHAQAALTGEYRDVHCSVFTPRSFLSLMVDIARLGLIWFAFEKIYPTEERALEFTVHLTAADDRHIIEESFRQALTALVASEQHAPFLPQDEPARLREQIAAQQRRIEALEQEISAPRRGILSSWRGGPWRPASS